MSAQHQDSYNTIVVLVENKAGVLARVADLFARRGFNIFSLTVAPTRDERLSRITIVVNVESTPLEQVINQLFKLVNVVEIAEMAPEQAIERELLICTVTVPEESKAVFDQLMVDFKGNVLSDLDGQVSVSIGGWPQQLDEFETGLEQFDVVYLQRSGRIALPKIGRRVPRHSIEV